MSVQTFTRFPKLDREGEESKVVLFLRGIILRWSVGGGKVSSFFLLLNYETGFSTWDQLFPQIKLKSQTYWICSGRGSFRSFAFYTESVNSEEVMMSDCHYHHCHHLKATLQYRISLYPPPTQLTPRKFHAEGLKIMFCGIK